MKTLERVGSEGIEKTVPRRRLSFTEPIERLYNECQTKRSKGGVLDERKDERRGDS